MKIPYLVWLLAEDDGQIATEKKVELVQMINDQTLVFAIGACVSIWKERHQNHLCECEQKKLYGILIGECEKRFGTAREEDEEATDTSWPEPAIQGSTLTSDY